MSRCTGHCCKRFFLPYTYDEIAARYEEQVLGKGTITELERIGPMLIPLGTQYINPDGTWGLGEYYTCKNLQENGDCRIYENRPTMCRDYPYRSWCKYRGCTDDKERLILIEHLPKTHLDS